MLKEEEEEEGKGQTSENQNFVDFYEKKTIKAYMHHQQQIFLNLDYLNHWNDIYLNNLFMEKIEGRFGEEDYESFGYFDVCSKENMFKETLLKLYKNVKTIIIQATDDVHACQYPLSFAVLLEMMKRHQNIQKVVIKATRDDFDYYETWISYIWNKYKMLLKRMYETSKINIECTKDKRQGDWIIITR